MKNSVKKLLAIIQFCVGACAFIFSFQIPVFLGGLWLNPVLGILGVGLALAGLDILDKMSDSPSNKK